MVLLLVFSVPVLSSAMADTLRTCLEKEQSAVLEPFLNGKIMMAFNGPVKHSGTVTGREARALFMRIFAGYDTLRVREAYSNQTQGNAFIAFDWTIRESDSGKEACFRLFFTLKKEAGAFRLIKIQSLPK